MIERAIPKDILKYKAKMFGGLNARQLICIGIAAGLGFATWSVLGFIEVWQVRAIITAIPALIPLAFGWIEIQKQPLEKIGMDMFRENFLTPTTRRKEIHYPEMEKFAKQTSVTEADGTVRKLNVDKNGKIVVKRSQEIKTIR